MANVQISRAARAGSKDLVAVDRACVAAAGLVQAVNTFFVTYAPNLRAAIQRLATSAARALYAGVSAS